MPLSACLANAITLLLLVQQIKSFDVRSAWRVKKKDTDYFDIFSGNKEPLNYVAPNLCPEGLEALVENMYPGLSCQT